MSIGLRLTALFRFAQFFSKFLYRNVLQQDPKHFFGKCAKETESFYCSKSKMCDESHDKYQSRLAHGTDQGKWLMQEVNTDRLRLHSQRTDTNNYTVKNSARVHFQIQSYDIESVQSNANIFISKSPDEESPKRGWLGMFRIFG